MNELSLFSGAGGGLLASKLLGWRTIGYVEFNDYCQRVLRARIDDGILDEAPIFSDIRAFLSEGYAESYQGMVDVVSAGFPCQPFSIAGKQRGEDDERNMWPATIDVIRKVRPRHAFLENVPGLLSHEYIRRIFGDLAHFGYDVTWQCISAAETGAPHKRNRLWIVAHANSSHSREGGYREPEGKQFSRFCEDVPDTIGHGLQRRSKFKIGSKESKGEQQGCSPRRILGEGDEYGSWWAVEPHVGRVANGVASRVDRLKSLGNGQVPRVATTAWELLS